MAKKTVKDLDVAGKRVLVRVDFNVPQDKSGRITDDTRIRAALPTIDYLIQQKSKVILVSHLGRPKGKADEKYKMDPVAARLSELLERPVKKVDEAVGEVPRLAVEEMQGGDVILLENIRFYPEEEKNEENFAKMLAALADIYVNDAFGTAHRAHASTQGVAEFLPAVAGFLMEKELEMLGRLLANPETPFAAVIGGAKVSDKIAVLSNLIEKVDILIIGGGMANTFLKAQGFDIGKSLLEVDKIDLAKNLMKKVKNRGGQLLLPVDVVAAPGAAPDAEPRTVPVDKIPPEFMALDIGPETLGHFAAALKKARTVFWNGPMGVFEMKPFAVGTEALARELSEVKGITVIGGGDSVAAIKQAGLADRITHISTGGGAALEFLEGRQLPGVVALQDK